MITFQQALTETAARLEDAGCESPRLDATLLLSAAVKKDKIQLYAHPKTKLSPEEYAIFEGFVSRREKAEPIAYILGERGFWDIDLSILKGVLIPRPDTETLIEVVLDESKDKTAALNICDLGCGSGAIILSLLKALPGASGIAADMSDTALACTTDNARKLSLQDRLSVLKSNWFEGIPAQQFDLITSNPPYIPTPDMADLMRDVRLHEPHLALDGGTDGLEAYREIINSASEYLKEGGLLAFEVGQGQADDVATLIKNTNQFTSPRFKKDLAGIERVVFARAK